MAREIMRRVVFIDMRSGKAQRDRAPLVRGFLALAAALAGLRVVRRWIRRRGEIRFGTDEVSELPSPAVNAGMRPGMAGMKDEESELERSASAFDAASAAE